jgi:hypothetical protein
MLTEDELNWIRQVLSVEETESNLTEDELNWLKQISKDYDYDYDALIKLPPHYVRLKKTNFERNRNKGNVRKELEDLRKKMIKVTPQELRELRNKNVRESRNINNFSGIYIIHNCVKDIYYVGQAVKVFDRAYTHFVLNAGNHELYEDYSLGDQFSISLIPLENTSFSTLNELEDNAIRAYDSYQNGYNRVPGNIRVDIYIFKSDDYQKAADLIIDKIKVTELFLSLSNDHKRMKYTASLFSELRLPFNANFLRGFVKMIKEYQKANKKRIHKR